MQPLSKFNVILASWWYSSLYMDPTVHSMLRSGKLDAHLLKGWMEKGVMRPFICRAEDCGMKFSSFSVFVKHLSRKNCLWGIDKLKLEDFGVFVKGKVNVVDREVGKYVLKEIVL